MCLSLQVIIKTWEQKVKMTTIENKEEISDTDSGIIIHSGKKNTKTIFIKTVYQVQTSSDD